MFEKLMNGSAPFLLAQARTMTTVMFVGLPLALIAIIGSSPGNISVSEKVGFLVFLLPFWFANVIASVGLWQRKAWARHFLAASVSLPVFGFLVVALLIPDYWLLVATVSLLLSLAWYFYRRPTTIAYFESGGN